MCLPRLDGEPVFESLLGGRARFAFHLHGCIESEQGYDRNTAVLRTILRAEDGAAVEITDFCPRFPAKGRTFRPAASVRRIRPIAGQPRIRIEIAPYFDWGRAPAPSVRGVSHIRFRGEGNPAGFRVTTDAPVSYIVSQKEFILDQGFDFICGPDEPLSDSVHVMARDWQERTADDFGEPKTAFTACTFWNIDAPARVGREEEARELFDAILEQRTSLGLLSEDIDSQIGELWGNFPQTYSMVGIINAAGRLSQRWDSVV